MYCGTFKKSTTYHQITTQQKENIKHSFYSLYKTIFLLLNNVMRFKITVTAR